MDCQARFICNIILNIYFNLLDHKHVSGINGAKEDVGLTGFPGVKGEKGNMGINGISESPGKI
jgi:hypothetical protein